MMTRTRATRGLVGRRLCGPSRGYEYSSSRCRSGRGAEGEVCREAGNQRDRQRWMRRVGLAICRPSVQPLQNEPARSEEL
ncbi:hypothetical protein Micbo1qcDRAFT_1808 [Microdochium bolleyi]|uniref:Uncharacterized protein n=1 Tax=Microdochium bolleyi TaxID=196109 RepID=A0A136JHH6_9PEZI|nr:hypothetical protein Micbo1qcDRAFT_1808 [Microdochium bolleyi]